MGFLLAIRYVTKCLGGSVNSINQVNEADGCFVLFLGTSVRKVFSKKFM